MIHIDNNDDQFVATWVNDRGSIETRTIRVQSGYDTGFLFISFGKLMMLRVRRDHTRERETLEATVEIVDDEVTGLAMFVADNYLRFTSACVRHDDKETFTFMYNWGNDVVTTLLYVIECTKDSWRLLYDYVWSCDNRGFYGHAVIYDPFCGLLITDGLGDEISIASDDSGDIVDVEKKHLHGWGRLDKYGDVLDGKILGILRNFELNYYSIVVSHIDTDIDSTIYVFDAGSTPHSVRYLSENVIIWLARDMEGYWMWTVHNMADGSIYHIDK